MSSVRAAPPSLIEHCYLGYELCNATTMVHTPLEPEQRLIHTTCILIRCIQHIARIVVLFSIVTYRILQSATKQRLPSRPLSTSVH